MIWMAFVLGLVAGLVLGYVAGIVTHRKLITLGMQRLERDGVLTVDKSKAADVLGRRLAA